MTSLPFAALTCGTFRTTPATGQHRAPCKRSPATTLRRQPRSALRTLCTATCRDASAPDCQAAQGLDAGELPSGASNILPLAPAVTSPRKAGAEASTAAGADAASAAHSSHLLQYHGYCQSEQHDFQAASMGSSRMASKLRAEVAAAARDPTRRPVLLLGEPGLKKDHIAAQIHHYSSTPELPFIKVDCHSSHPDPASLLFGASNGDNSASGSSAGLLDSLRQTGGTLLLDNVHVVPEGRLRQQLRDLLLQGGKDGVRILLTAEHAMTDLELASTVIKVDPLRARPADIKELATHYLAQHAARAGGISFAMDSLALRHLTSYTYPFNLEELRSIVERVAIEAEAAHKKKATEAGLPLDLLPTSHSCSGSSASGGCSGGSCGGSSGGSCHHQSGGGSCGCADEGVVSETILLTQADFWHATGEKDRYRMNLLDSFPALRQLLRSGAFPAGLNTHITPYVYPLLLALLFWGPQDREHSVALNAVWSWWWPGIFMLYPLLGRWWCSVCPFMVAGDLAQGWRTATWPHTPLLKWPKQAAEQYGGWFLVSLFAGILVWEDVWRLNDSAYLTGWLLAIITGGAVASSVVFPKRFWCRYLCPIGGMNGLFAKLSCTEIRSQQGVCSAQCTTYSCLKGPPSPAASKKQKASNSDCKSASSSIGASSSSMLPPGCPMASHSNAMADNQVCTMCSTCLALCPHDNVELRLRPPGIDLWTSHKPSASEASLLFLLLGAAYLHHLPELMPLLHLDPSLLDNQLTACSLSTAVLAVPGLLIWGGHTAATHYAASRQGLAGSGGSSSGNSGGSSFWGSLASGSADELSPLMRSSASFLTLAYAYVPLVWAATMAHHGKLFLEEAGLVLQVGAASLEPFGLSASTASSLPALSAHPAVTAFVQGCLLALGTGGSLALLAALSGSRKRASDPGALWMHQGVLLLTALSLYATILD